jgi:GNAT superfamily N-acetyltransferase
VRTFATVFDVACRRWTLPVADARITNGGGGAALWTPPGEWKTRPAIRVDPDHQGRGIGSALLAAQLAECRARGEAAYLEASTENDARLYERHRFRVTKVMDTAEDGPRLRLMRRDAQP